MFGLPSHQLYIGAVVSAVIGLIITFHIELWRWTWIFALIALILFFASVRQHDKERG